MQLRLLVLPWRVSPALSRRVDLPFAVSEVLSACRSHRLMVAFRSIEGKRPISCLRLKANVCMSGIEIHCSSPGRSNTRPPRITSSIESRFRKSSTGFLAKTTTSARRPVAISPISFQG